MTRIRTDKHSISPPGVGCHGNMDTQTDTQTKTHTLIFLYIYNNIIMDHIMVLSHSLFWLFKVLESVIRWVKHDLDSRKKLLPKLMAHVRLPLTSKDYILKHVVTEPLLNNCSESKFFNKYDFLWFVLYFNLTIC